MKCSACDAELPADAAFCHKCGASLSTGAGKSAPATSAGGPPAGKSGRGPLPFTPAHGDDQEEMLWQGQFSKLAMLGSWIAGGVFTVIAIVVGLVAGFTPGAWGIAAGVIVLVWVGLVLRLLYLQLSLHYYLTSQRFIHERGLLWREVDRIETIDIDDVGVVQGPVERMLKIGSIRLRSSDATTPEFLIQGIEDVRRVATLIDEARRKERRRRGMYIESV
ncbi:MAG: PH domain-containing protein [Planctomycetaceae bacterium]|nr:PH domain-containing protein [Planctomycetaceae bacterium]